MLKFFAFLPLLLTCFPGQQDLEELIARHIEAMGGVQRQKAIQTVRVTQKVETGDPARDYEFTIMRKRGNKFRMEDPAITNGCDGQKGWIKFGNLPAKAAPGNCSGLADIDSLLMDYKEKGISVELVGKEEIEGQKLYHLKVTRKNGRLLHFYLDAETFLLARIVGEENGMHHEDIFSDYRKVDGIMVPFTDQMRWWELKNTDQPATSSSKIEPEQQKQITEKIEFNVPLDDSLFAMPSENKKKP
jgi:hypothetical protein